MKCPRCPQDNTATAKFCENCGAPLSRSCANCGTTLSASANFCPECGQPAGASPAVADRFRSPQSYTPKHLAEKILTSRAVLEGERKTVTVLFCDIAGSTSLAERLGAEAMHGVLNDFFELSLAEVHRYEGTINQFLGDGFMALFGAPVAHEDHARRAVLAALEVQRALRDRAAALVAKAGRELATRMGLNTGPVVVGKIGDNLRMDYTAIGDTTNLAARLQQMAEPGTILMSDDTRRLVEAYVEKAFQGEREIKGFGPKPVYSVERLKPGAARFDIALSRGLTPLVGRQRELETLERCWTEVRTGVLRVVNIVGEAGIGKSRLLYELRQRLEGERLPLLQGHCSAYGATTSFLPFVEIVRTAFRLSEADDQPEIERKLRRGVELLDIRAEPVLPFLLNLLGLDPGREAFQGLDGEIVGMRTREVLQALLRERTRRSPVVLIADDLHWTDTASEDLLLRLVRSAEPMPLLIVGAYRPQYRPPWAGHAAVTELRLEPLSEASCLQLIQRRLGTDNLPGELTRLIVDKAEGNPLFAEELTRYLQESGRLLRTEVGVSFRAEGADGVVPGTLHDLIMSRVDRLAEEPRSVLQAASVIGRRFTMELVRAASGVNGRLSDYLRDLEGQELIFAEAAPGRAEYAFKHVLIQEAIYESLLTPRREALHQRVGEAIEQSYADRLVEWAEVLAHHWSRTPRADKAVRWLAQAGEKSLRVYSLDEAHERLRRVVELIEAVPGSADDAFLADVLLSWARVHYFRMDFKGLIAAVEPYLARIETLGDKRRLSLLLFWLGFSHYFGARFAIATRLLEKALALGEALDDEECVGYACMGLMWVNALRRADQPAETVNQLGDRGLIVAERLGDVYLASKCLLALSVNGILRGRFGESRVFAMRLLELSRKASDPRTTAMGLYALAWVNGIDERYEEAIELAEEALRMSPDPQDRLMALHAKGMALALQGRGREGVEILSEARRGIVEADGLAALVGLDIPLGAAMVLAGDMAAGIRWIEDSMRRFAGWGDRGEPAWGHLILGEIYLMMALGGEKPPPRVILRNLGFLLRTLPFAARKARRHLDEAIRRTRELGHPGILARGLLDLGLLCRAKKRPAEAARYFEEALRIAEPHSSVLSQKIRQALESPDVRA